MKRLPVVPHLSYEEIDRRYRSCSDAAEKTRWHVLRPVTRPDQPLSATKAAELVGFTPGRARAILDRYDAHGPDALADRRRDNGAAAKLSTERQAQLRAAPQVAPPDRGLWSGPKVAAHVKERFGVEVRNQTGWQWLKDLGCRLAVPRPRHPRAATPEQRRVWL